MSGPSVHTVTPSAPPESGVEDPSKFMMGVEGTPEDEAAMDAAIASAFGLRPDATQDNDQTEDGGTDTEVEGGDASTSEISETGAGDAAGAQEGGEEGGEIDEEAGATSSTESDFATLFEARYQRPPTPDEITGLLSLADWAANLTPEVQAAIDAAYRQQQLIPPGAQQNNQQQYTPPATTQTDEWYEEYKDDPQFGPVVERLRMLEANVNNIASKTIQDTQQSIRASLEMGSNAFKETYPVSDPELEALQGAVANMQILPALVQANNGNYQSAMNQALEYVFFRTPSLRNRMVEKEVAANTTKETAHSQRKAKAASVTGTGANGASRTQAPPSTPDGRWAAVTDGLREAMSNGQPQ